MGKLTKESEHAWLKKMAELEEKCESVSVGGLAVELGIYNPQKETNYKPLNEDNQTR